MQNAKRIEVNREVSRVRNNKRLKKNRNCTKYTNDIV